MRIGVGICALSTMVTLGFMAVPFAFGDEKDEGIEPMTEAEASQYEKAKAYDPEVRAIVRYIFRNWHERPERQAKIRRLREIEQYAYPILVHLYKKEEWPNAQRALVFLKEGRQFLRRQMRQRKTREDAFGTTGAFEANHGVREEEKDFLPEYLELLKEILVRDREVNGKGGDQENKDRGEGKKEGQKKQEWILQVADGIMSVVAYIGDRSALPLLKELEEKAYDQVIRKEARRTRIKIETITIADADTRLPRLMEMRENKISEGGAFQSWAEAMLMVEADKTRIVKYYRDLLKQETEKPDNERLGNREFRYLDRIDELDGTLTDAEKAYMVRAREELRFNLAKSDLPLIDDTTLAPKE